MISGCTTAQPLDINTHFRHEKGVFCCIVISVPAICLEKQVNQLNQGIKCKAVVEFRFLPSLIVHLKFSEPRNGEYNEVFC